MEGWVYYNSRKVYAILEDQQFMYYNDFDKVMGTPKRLQGVVYMRDGKVEKVKTNSERHGFHIRSKNWKGSGVFGTDGPAVNSSWYSALFKSTTLHTTKDELLEAPRKHRASLGLPIDGFLQKKDITRAYKKACLKHHPDRGGDKEEFNRVQDAYSAIMSIHELEEVEQNSILIDYEAVLVKDAQSGLGIVVKEDPKGRVVISKIEARVNIDSMSDEAGGAIHIGDAIVSIDDDDCSEWPLSRIKGRLGPARVPAGGKVLFTFERRVPVQEDEADKKEQDAAADGPSFSQTTTDIHPSWSNSEEVSEEEPPQPPPPEAPRPYSRRRPSVDHLTSPLPPPPTDEVTSRRRSPSFGKDSPTTEVEGGPGVIEQGEEDVQDSESASRSRRESLREGLKNLEEFDEEQLQEVLYTPSPMMDRARGSIKELANVSNSIEPLHRMEELFELLEAVRKAEAYASSAKSDAYTLKDLIAQEHKLAESENHSRSDHAVARLTSFRYSAAQESSDSFKKLATNLGISATSSSRCHALERVENGAFTMKYTDVISDE